MCYRCFGKKRKRKKDFRKFREQKYRAILNSGQRETFQWYNTKEEEGMERGKAETHGQCTSDKVPVLIISASNPNLTDERNMALLNRLFTKHIRSLASKVWLIGIQLSRPEDVYFFVAGDLPDLQDLAQQISYGMEFAELGDFPLQAVSIFLYPNIDPDVHDEEDPKTPLLGEKRKKTDFMCCCIPISRELEKFEFDVYEKSEFGWFYSSYATGNGLNHLETSIERMHFASEEMNQEQVEVLVHFFIDFYVRALTRELIEPTMKDTESFRKELATRMVQSLKDPDAITSEDVVRWFTHDMPRIYCKRCLCKCPNKWKQNCPSPCIIS